MCKFDYCEVFSSSVEWGFSPHKKVVQPKTFLVRGVLLTEMSTKHLIAVRFSPHKGRDPKWSLVWSFLLTKRCDPNVSLAWGFLPAIGATLNFFGARCSPRKRCPWNIWLPRGFLLTKGVTQTFLWCEVFSTQEVWPKLSVVKHSVSHTSLHPPPQTVYWCEVSPPDPHKVSSPKCTLLWSLHSSD